MAIEFVDEKGTNLNRYKLIPVSGQSNVYDLQRMASITTPGTPLNAANLNQLAQKETVDLLKAGAYINATARKTGTRIDITSLESNAKRISFVAPSDFDKVDTYFLNNNALEVRDLKGQQLTADTAWKYGTPVDLTIINGIGFFKSGGKVVRTIFTLDMAVSPVNDIASFKTIIIQDNPNNLTIDNVVIGTLAPVSSKNTLVLIPSVSSDGLHAPVNLIDTSNLHIASYLNSNSVYINKKGTLYYPTIIMKSTEPSNYYASKTSNYYNVITFLIKNDLSTNLTGGWSKVSSTNMSTDLSLNANYTRITYNNKSTAGKGVAVYATNNMIDLTNIDKIHINKLISLSKDSKNQMFFTISKNRTNTNSETETDNLLLHSEEESYLDVSERIGNYYLKILIYMNENISGNADFYCIFGDKKAGAA